MKWFKHIADSLDDPFIFDLVSKFKGDGYLVFFGTLEIMSREFDVNSPGTCRVSLKFLSKKFQLSTRFILKSLNFCMENGRILYELDKDMITLNCPKLIKMCDEFTQKALKQKSGVNPDQIGIESRIDTDKDKELDKDIIPPTPRKRWTDYSAEFQSFWNNYPKKVGKDAAWRAWKKRNGDRPATGLILEALYNQRKSEQWTRDNGQYIPNPATWINQGRWADEVEVKPKSRWESLTDESNQI